MAGAREFPIHKPIDGHKTILLVEDEPIISMAEKLILEKSGYQVLTTLSGEKAIQAIEEEPGIDLILMDINLGAGIDGTEAASRILEKRDLPIVFLSSHTEQDIVSRTEGISSYGYIVKNSGKTVLLASIKMAFRLFDARNGLRNREAHYHSLFDGLTQIQEQLAESRAELKAIYDTAPVLMCVVDENRRVLYANPAFTAFTGISEAELKGGSACGIFGCINALEDPRGCGFGMSCDACTLREAMEDTLKTGTEHRDVEYNTTFFNNGVRKETSMLGSTVLIDSFDPPRLLLCLYDITERTLAERQVRALLGEKELLLRETHHRVKNNMTLINSLLGLQAREQVDAGSRKALEDAAGRMQSMMVLYDRLYRSDNFKELNMRDFLPPLIQEIIQVYRTKLTVRTEVNIEDFMLDAKLLSPIGIIINEMITNSMKYAFKDRAQGLISISVAKNGGEITLTYKDDGNGIPETTSLENSKGFGMQLIDMLVQQIGGTITLSRNGGTKYVISFMVEQV